MNRSLMDDLAHAFAEANADPATRAVIFTGAGRAFCAGDDRREPVHPDEPSQAREFVNAIQCATQEIVFGDVPVVGAINGWAVEGGFELAINCDFPIWAASARGFFPDVARRVCHRRGERAVTGPGRAQQGPRNAVFRRAVRRPNPP